MSASKGWAKPAPLGDLLIKNDRTTAIENDETYREVTIKLWGKGVVERRTTTGSEIAAARRSVVNAGDFILSRIDARNGAMGIIPAELDGAVVSNDFPSFATVEDRLLPEYLGWLSKTRGFVDACRRASEGTTNRVRLKEEKFLKQTIPLPPLSEQRRIVAKIERLGEKIAEAREHLANIDGKTSVFATSLHARLSEGRVRRLDELIELDEDRVGVTSDGAYPQIGIRGFGGGLFLKSAVRGCDTSYKHFNRIKDGQLVLSQVKGWEGAIAVATEEEVGWFASPEYRTFTCIEAECVPQYLDRIVRTSWFRSKLMEATRGQGARRERTRPEMLLAIEVPFPDVDRQARALDWLNGIAKANKLRRRFVPKIEAFMPAVLDRAFQGKLITQSACSSSTAGEPTVNRQLAKRAMFYVVILLRRWNKPVARNVLDACLALMLNDQARKKILRNDSFQASSADRSSPPLRGLDSLLGQMRARKVVEITTRSEQQFLELGHKAPSTNSVTTADRERLEESIAAFEIVGEDRAATVLAEMIDTTYELAAT